mgnify:FL=1
MLVKDIIALACDFTENSDLKKALEENEALTDEQNVLCDSLVKCFNLVNNEIASEYIPHIKSETIKTQDFRIDFSSLSYSPCQIISVRDTAGRMVKFKVFDDYIIAMANVVEVVYTTLPHELTLQSQFSSVLPERVYAYGIAREYYFLQTLFDDADIWEERFKNTLQVLQRKRSDTVMPRRRWL